MQEPFSLTPSELRRLAPKGRHAILTGIAAYSPLLEEYGITVNELRLCHFLAQAAHETAGFRTLVEYGKSSYFRRLYGGRRDLGNRSAADGARYRGRGIFQLTGRYNYRRYGKIVGIDLERRPQRAAEPAVSLKVAAEYWRNNGLNKLADDNNIRAITRRINGGYNGLADRRRYFSRALSIWAPAAAASKVLLRAGDRGSLVRQLQRQLSAQGFGLVEDGLFGRRTRAALVDWQKRRGLRADGIYGPRSHKLLQSLQPAPSPKVPPRTTPETNEKENIMDQWKSYLRSRTIWANLIGLMALGLDMTGLGSLSGEDQSELVDALLKVVEAGGFIAGMVFRAIARKRLGPILL